MEVLYCGFSAHGQFGQRNHVHSITDVSTASCCWSNLIFVTNSGSKSVLLGFWDGKPNQRVEAELPNGETIKKVSSCPNKIVCLSTSGNIWQLKSESWLPIPFCDRKCENLAINQDSIFVVCERLLYNVLKDCLIPISGYIDDFCCGAEHNLALTNQGDVYSWGSSMRGQLGRGDLGSSQIPLVIDALSGLGVKQISCGLWHSAALTTSGDVYCWGWNRDGQLGLPHPSLTVASETAQNTDTEKVSVLVTPEPLDIPFRVKQVACGARHTVILADDDSVWGCGWSSHGQLGEHRSDSSFAPVAVTSRKVNAVSAGGWATMLFLSKD